MLLVQRDADARVADGEVQQPLLRKPEKLGIALVTRIGGAPAVRSGVDFHHDLAFLREFDGVAEEVDQDLTQACHVADENLRHAVVHVVGQVQVLLGGLGGEQVQGFFNARVQLEGMAFQFQLARLNL